MYVICIESSHQRGMGHFYRALNFIEYLSTRSVDSVLLINNHAPSISILKKININYVVVDLHAQSNGWEKEIIEEYAATVWVNDRLNTNKQHALNVKSTGIKLVTFDDRGRGASFADLHFAPLVFGQKEVLSGKKIFRGADYLILNKGIGQYRHLRKQRNKVIVTLGGSDTYGATIEVIKKLHSHDCSITVLAGPAFEHQEQLMSIIGNGVDVVGAVDSLIQYFSEFDLAITGGGVTPFEANASGLPCIVIANEWFEEPVCEYLQSTGGAVYAGTCGDINEVILNRPLDIESMSRAAMAHIDANGAERVYQVIESN